MSFRKFEILTASLIMAQSLSAQIQSETPFGTQGSCNSEVYLGVDYLLFYANQDGLSYATTANSLIPTSGTGLTATTTSLNEKDQFFSNQWKSGVRGTLGVKPKGVSWDTNLSYTYFSSNISGKSNSTTFDGQTGGAGTPGIGNIVLNDYLLNAIDQFAGTTSFDNDPHWKLNFNQLDWELGRGIFVGSDTLLRPFFGLRGLWTNQCFSGSTTTSLPTSLDTIPVTELVKFNHKNRFNSFGARAGFDANFSLGCGFDFYGSLAGSILWGRFHVNQAYNRTDAFSSGTIVVLEEEGMDHSHFSSIFNFDLGLGLRWNTRFDCGRYLFSLKFGWEQHIYTKMNQFQNFYLEEISSGDSFTFDRNVERGDLSLSGFVFGATIVF